jgi:hypothetical protein
VSAVEARLESVRAKCVEAARAFGWPFIARTYADLYEAAVAGSHR